jgi:uncharacterized SAM-binding protein YcdF (DUF218 family)
VIFAASKVLWTVAAPGNLLLLLLLWGVLRLVLSGGRRGRGIAAVATLALLVLAVTPVADWLGGVLENRFPQLTAAPEHVDGIILLGGSFSPLLSAERGLPEMTSAADRVTSTVALARRYPEARIVFTGGDASLGQGGLTEAVPARRLLTELGIPPERLEIEEHSRNTWENATMTHALVQPVPGQVWLLVTSAMHMPRAVGCFRRAGWTVVPYPVDYRTLPSVPFGVDLAFPGELDLLNLVAHEWDGLIAYWLLGRMDALLPAP